MDYKGVVVAAALLAITAAAGVRLASLVSNEAKAEKPENVAVIEKLATNNEALIDELCEAEARLADTVLYARQQGRTLRETFALMKMAEEPHERSKEIVLGAYNFMLGYGPAQRAEMRNLYSDSVQSDCYNMWRNAK